MNIKHFFISIFAIDVSSLVKSCCSGYLAVFKLDWGWLSGQKRVQNSFFLNMAVSLTQNHLLKIPSFLHHIALSFVRDHIHIVDHICIGVFLGFLFCSIDVFV